MRAPTPPATALALLVLTACGTTDRPLESPEVRLTVEIQGDKIVSRRLSVEHGADTTPDEVRTIAQQHCATTGATAQLYEHAFKRPNGDLSQGFTCEPLPIISGDEATDVLAPLANEPATGAAPTVRRCMQSKHRQVCLPSSP